MTADDRVLLSRAQKWTLVVSCLSVALVVASMAALYTALPNIAVATGATQTQLTWVVDGYTLVLACLVLPAGALGDRYGRRAVLIVGLALFSLASAVPLLVSTPWWLIAARAAAGVGAAFMMPSTLSILTAGFPEQQRGRAVGIWAGVAGSGGLLGILGSGLLLNYWSWQSIFVGLTAVGVFLLLCAFTIPESRQENPPLMDVIGSVAVVFAVGLVVLAIIEAPVRGWSDPVVVAGFGLGVVATVVFVVWELRADHPLLDVRFFARRGFGSGSFSITIQFLVTFGVFLVLVQYLQLIFGYSPLGSALALAPMMVPLVLLSAVAPWMTIPGGPGSAASGQATEGHRPGGSGRADQETATGHLHHTSLLKTSTAPATGDRSAGRTQRLQPRPVFLDVDLAAGEPGVEQAHRIVAVRDGSGADAVLGTEHRSDAEHHQRPETEHGQRHQQPADPAHRTPLPHHGRSFLEARCRSSSPNPTVEVGV